MVEKGVGFAHRRYQIARVSPLCCVCESVRVCVYVCVCVCVCMCVHVSTCIAACTFMDIHVAYPAHMLQVCCRSVAGLMQVVSIIRGHNRDRLVDVAFITS